MSDKTFLSPLKPLVNNTNQWKAFCDMIDYHINLEQRKLEQSSDMKDIFQAQGAVTKLRQFKKLKDEINATKD
jgi:hypothetical protein